MGLSKKLIQPPPSSAPKPARDAYKRHARASMANETRRRGSPLGKAPARGKPPSTKPRQLGGKQAPQVPRAGSPAAKTALKNVAGAKQAKINNALRLALKKK